MTNKQILHNTIDLYMETQKGKTTVGVNTHKIHNLQNRNLDKLRSYKHAMLGENPVMSHLVKGFK